MRYFNVFTVAPLLFAYKYARAATIDVVVGGPGVLKYTPPFVVCINRYCSSEYILISMSRMPTPGMSCALLSNRRTIQQRSHRLKALARLLQMVLTRACEDHPTLY